MVITPNHVTITNPDGSTTTIDVTWAAATVPDPPAGPTFPDKANTVTIGTASYPLAAIDPPTNDAKKPGGRDTDQVIIVTKSTTPPRNPWGYEITVFGGKVVAKAINLTLTSGIDYIVSGHGKGAEFLKNVALGSTVSVTKEDVAPPVTPPATGHAIMGEYLMIGTGKVSQLYPRCRRAIVAFYQGTDLVTWNGGFTETNGLTAWRAQGSRDVLVSLGGQGGTVVLDQVDEGIERINRTRFPVDGIDFDNEAFGLSTAQTIDICDATSGRLGRAPQDFIVQFVPPGGREDAAIATAKAVQAKGYKVYLGQQLYETAIADSDVIRQTKKAVDVLGAPAVLVGMMIGDSHNSWTVANTVTRMQSVLGNWKDIGGAYIWESSRAGTEQVVDGVGNLLGL